MSMNWVAILVNDEDGSCQALGPFRTRAKAVWASVYFDVEPYVEGIWHIEQLVSWVEAMRVTS